ncbi:transient receptor potential channel pyrexia-like [Sitophilus oryzae]|uniref:Transient receptor potential channel pyrexia-like n=1 Tax=Sitophilus oryzae TaxID=7048 RepID=A0A6J2X8E5_SITOR|nr:transient receptor potential channel pyrexia-like [Sitophilus oryzae]
MSDCQKRTPLHEAVQSISSARKHIVKMLLDNGTDVNALDEDGFSPLHLAALNEIPQYANLLVDQGANLTASGNSKISPFGLLAKKTPAVLDAVKNRLDQSITLIPDPDELFRTEIEFNFDKGLPHPDEYKILKTFIEEGQPEMLLHPICRAFLFMTWKRLKICYYGMIYSWFRLCFCLLFFVLTGMSYRCNLVEEEVLYCKNSYAMNKTLFESRFNLKMQWYLMIYITVSILYSKAYDFHRHPSIKNYFLNISNQLEWVSLFGVVAICPLYSGTMEKWQLEVGAWILLTSWTNLMFLVGQLPCFGPYVDMYQKIQREFYKLFFVFSFFLVGYVGSFYIFIPQSSAFKDLFIGAITVLILMTGDLNYDYLVKYEYANTVSRIGTHAVCVIFVLYVTIILMNLFVGIAVDDIETLEKNAGLSKLVRQVKLCSYIEKSYCNRIFLNFFLKIIGKIPKKYTSRLKVKPLDPTENKMPKNIMHQAYNIVKNRNIDKEPIFEQDEVLSDIEHGIEDRNKQINMLHRYVIKCKESLTKY